MTCWPTLIPSESPIRATRMALVTRSSCRSATSAAALAEMIVARTTSPAMPSTVISSMPLTTWAAVITRPSLEIRTPEPVSLKRMIPAALTSRPLLRTTTTVGLTRLKRWPRLGPRRGAATWLRRAPWRRLSSWGASGWLSDEIPRTNVKKGPGASGNLAVVVAQGGPNHDHADDVGKAPARLVERLRENVSGHGGRQGRQGHRGRPQDLSLRGQVHAVGLRRAGDLTRPSCPR